MNMLKKTKVGILFGGRSAEHEVSIVSAQSIAKALDPEKYEAILIGINKEGQWLLPGESNSLLKLSGNDVRQVKIAEDARSVTLLPYQASDCMIDVASGSHKSSNPKIDVIFPVLHGTYGEDGTMQGLLELANIPYVGSGVLGSAIGMDKEIAKVLFAAAGIPVVPFISLRKHQFEKSPEESIAKAIRQFGFPFFIKPANMGSSVGVHKIKSETECLAKFKNAFLYDTKILIEKAIDARELECSVLGNDHPQASVVGELSATHEFYSYEAKYVDPSGAEYSIPAKGLSPQQSEKIREFAVRAFTAIECRGMARVDFFLDRKTGEIYLNEINTIPGFTQISMYPKMWEASGVPYKELLSRLVQLAVERHREKSQLKTSYIES